MQYFHADIISPIPHVFVCGSSSFYVTCLFIICNFSQQNDKIYGEFDKSLF